MSLFAPEDQRVVPINFLQENDVEMFTTVFKNLCSPDGVTIVHSKKSSTGKSTKTTYFGCPHFFNAYLNPDSQLNPYKINRSPLELVLYKTIFGFLCLFPTTNRVQEMFFARGQYFLRGVNNVTTITAIGFKVMISSLADELKTIVSDCDLLASFMKKAEQWLALVPSDSENRAEYMKAVAEKIASTRLKKIETEKKQSDKKAKKDIQLLTIQVWDTMPEDPKLADLKNQLRKYSALTKITDVHQYLLDNNIDYKITGTKSELMKRVSNLIEKKLFILFSSTWSSVSSKIPSIADMMTVDFPVDVALNFDSKLIPGPSFAYSTSSIPSSQQLPVEQTITIDPSFSNFTPLPLPGFIPTMSHAPTTGIQQVSRTPSIATVSNHVPTVPIIPVLPNIMKVARTTAPQVAHHSTQIIPRSIVQRPLPQVAQAQMVRRHLPQKIQTQAARANTPPNVQMPVVQAQVRPPVNTTTTKKVAPSSPKRRNTVAKKPVVSPKRKKTKSGSVGEPPLKRSARLVKDVDLRLLERNTLSYKRVSRAGRVHKPSFKALMQS
eukprot:TRINITY_DN2350_c0_g1_i1.p1 TRINITY_DN2350_c0_g1~~TRINITY_DN2350_c0_g1_i1.p1  ORF type:complete len:550 (-),score=149.81 TRINITY_DN2350_c0_g1_i1:94-1743(-)